VILVVAATQRELDYLDDVPTLVCGIGPVESALATSASLARQSPHALVHVGIAGARELPTATLVLGSEAVYCDVIDPSSSMPRVERASPDPGLLASARRALPGALVLPVATSARVGGGGSFEVEAMEGFGVLRAAALAQVPAVELRAVSNAVAEPDRARWRIDEALAALAAAVPVLLEALDA
jgi:nucleoside phosphorylase